MACYFGLVLLTRDKATRNEPADSTDPSIGAGNSTDPDGSAQSDDSVNFNFFAIAGAMFLLVSIAGADLLVPIELLCRDWERTPHWWKRRFFGVAMLFNFGLLVYSSMLVLFFSSDGNVELVVGAAAVLFIADIVSFLVFPGHCVVSGCIGGIFSWIPYYCSTSDRRFHAVCACPQ